MQEINNYMKKLSLLIVVVLMFTGCFPDEDGPNYEFVSGELTHTIEIDWSDLPPNEDIARTDLLSLNEFIAVSTNDFDAPAGKAIIAPQLVGLYYDIRGIESGNSIGLFEASLSAIADGGYTERLTDFTIVDVENTITLDNDNNEVFAEIPIFDPENPGNTNANGLALITTTMARGRINIKLDGVGKNIHLVTSGERFEIVLKFELLGRIESDQ